jgi:LPS export ABC transporter protein LptC/lipopolysaccharide transport protein LptA
MLKWQKVARIAMVLMALGCVVLVAATLGRRTPPSVAAPVATTDPKAVVESAGGISVRLNRDKEQIRLEYDKVLTYADGSTKLINVTVTTEREGRTFVMKGDEGKVGERDATIELSGHIHVTASDGLVLTTDRATYLEAEGIARAPGHVDFARGRMKGSGVGFNYDKNQDILTILDQAAVYVAPDAKGTGSMDVASGGLEFRRSERTIRFDRSMRGARAREILEADLAVAHLTADEEHLEAVELRGQSRITVAKAAAGGLQAMTGRDIDLKYGADGGAIQHALIAGDAAIQLAGNGAEPGRQISAATIDVSIAGDGATPTALTARDNVKVSLPGQEDGVSRTITARSLESAGDGQGLKTAHFAEKVEFVERGSSLARTARSNVLDVTLERGFASIEDAKFAQGVRFVDGGLTATAAAARYIPKTGVVELTGKEAASPAPHVVNDRIAIDATALNLTLEGPIINAKGSVKSVLQPQKRSPEQRGDEIRVPSMLKQDQPVNVTADALDYDGVESRAIYTGNALLWQGETSIKAASLTIDSRKGDMTAAGPVLTVANLQQNGKDGGRERVRTRGSAGNFKYEDAERRAVYTDDAHLIGPQGDLTGARIEVFFKPSGEELERIEGYDKVKLRADTQTTTGRRVTYFGDEGRYLMDGAPVKIVDECGRETTGHTLTFYRSTDRIVIDGQIRTQTKGKSSCVGS